MMFSIGMPADKTYRSVALENGVQVVAQPRTLISLYVLNTSGATVYLLLSDDNAGPNGIGTDVGEIYPITAGGYVAIGNHGGDQFNNGIYVGAYSTAALAAAGGAPDSGNVLYIKVGMQPSKIMPQNA